jgi:hypothetical protein
VATLELDAAPQTPAVDGTVLLGATVRNDADAVTDPAGITLVYKKPDGSETTVPVGALSHVALSGRYTYNVAVDQAGTWAFRFEATGPAVANEDDFLVAGSAIQGDPKRGSGPCDAWCTPADVVNGWTAPAGVTQDQLELACWAASEVCFELGGRRWPGVCFDTVLPTTVYPSGNSGFIVWPVNGGGLATIPGVPDGARFPLYGPEWENALRLDLGVAPVVKVEAVRLSGVALDLTDVVVVDGRWLVRTDGSLWPWFNSPSFDPPAIEVDVTYGEAPPRMGHLAALGLARQLTLAIKQDNACSLNRKVRRIVREGVELELAVPGLVDNLRDGFTGVPEVDLFVGTMNPNKLRRAARVIVPGQSFPSRLG